MPSPSLADALQGCAEALKSAVAAAERGCDDGPFRRTPERATYHDAACD